MTHADSRHSRQQNVPLMDRHGLTTYIVLLDVVVNIFVDGIVLNGTDCICGNVCLHVGLTNMEAMDTWGMRTKGSSSS